MWLIKPGKKKKCQRWQSGGFQGIYVYIKTVKSR